MSLPSTSGVDATDSSSDNATQDNFESDHSTTSESSFYEPSIQVERGNTPEEPSALTESLLAMSPEIREKIFKEFFLIGSIEGKFCCAINLSKIVQLDHKTKTFDIGCRGEVTHGNKGLPDVWTQDHGLLKEAILVRLKMCDFVISRARKRAVNGSEFDVDPSLFEVDLQCCIRSVTIEVNPFSSLACLSSRYALRLKRHCVSMSKLFNERFENCSNVNKLTLILRKEFTSAPTIVQSELFPAIQGFTKRKSVEEVSFLIGCNPTSMLWQPSTTNTPVFRSKDQIIQDCLGSLGAALTRSFGAEPKVEFIARINVHLRSFQIRLQMTFPPNASNQILEQIKISWNTAPENPLVWQSVPAAEESQQSLI